jgi:transposase
MSLHPRSIDPIPEATACVARQAFPKGNRYLLLRDELGTIYTDAEFAPLFSVHGQFAISPWRLALICVMQFLEDLTGRQAADAFRSRIDWKYLLSLELGDPEFDFSVLSEFRTRVIAGHLEQRLLDRPVTPAEEAAVATVEQQANAVTLASLFRVLAGVGAAIGGVASLSGSENANKTPLTLQQRVRQPVGIALTKECARNNDPDCRTGIPVVIYCSNCCLSAIADTKLFQNAANMSFHRTLTDIELPGDYGISISIYN